MTEKEVNLLQKCSFFDFIVEQVFIFELNILFHYKYFRQPGEV